MGKPKSPTKTTTLNKTINKRFKRSTQQFSKFQKKSYLANTTSVLYLTCIKYFEHLFLISGIYFNKIDRFLF